MQISLTFPSLTAKEINIIGAAGLQAQLGRPHGDHTPARSASRVSSFLPRSFFKDRAAAHLSPDLCFSASVCGTSPWGVTYNTGPASLVSS